MRRLGIIWVVAAIASIGLLGCGHFTSPGSGGTNKAQFSLTLHDTPPANTTVLSFRMTILSAVLQPGNVPIFIAPETFDFTQLQTDTTLVSTLQIPAGTYTSLDLVFENPSLTFINNTPSPITPNLAPQCLAAAICQITPFLQSASISLNTAPFPLTILVNTPVGLELDVNLSDLIQNDFSVNVSAPGAMGLSTLPSVTGTAVMQSLNHTLGTVNVVGSNQFTFTTATGMALGFNVNGSTLFSYPSSQCLSNNFACVQTGHLIDVSYSLLANGTLLATEIDFEDKAGAVAADGLIVALDPGSPPVGLQVMVRSTTASITGVSDGAVIDVVIQTGATFAPHNFLFTLPAGLTFTDASSLLVGQEVLVGISVAAGPPVIYSTDQITLRRSQFTGLIAIPPVSPATSFVMSPTPSLLDNASPVNITQLLVDTTAQTDFENLTPNSLTGVVLGNNISVGGFLFNAGVAGARTMAADSLRGQPIPGP